MTENAVERIRPPDLNDAHALSEFRRSMDESGLDDVAKIDFDYIQTNDVIAGVAVVRMQGSRPPDSKQVLLHIHGGAYIIGSARGNASIPLQIAELTGMEVVSVEYRLAPEHPYPAAVDDVLTVYRELATVCSPQNIGVFGESAGGGITAAFGLALRDAGEPMPGAMALIAPFADMTGSGESIIGNDGLDPDLDWDSLDPGAIAYVGDGDPNDPCISPVFAEFNGFPPLIIQAGSREILLSDAERISENARSAGVDVTFDVWKEMWHCFHFDPSLPEARRACGDIAAFFGKHLNFCHS